MEYQLRRQRPQTHVAVFAFPFGTHAGPLLALVRRLGAAAPEARFSFFSTARSNAQTFYGGPKSNPCENIKAYDVGDGLPEGYEFAGNVPEAIGFFLAAAEGNFRRGVEEVQAATGEKVCCLLTDAFLWFAGEMAAEMGVPWVPAWFSGTGSLSAHIYTDVIRKTLRNAGAEVDKEQPLKFISGMAEVQIDDLPEGVLCGDLESPFARLLYNMGLNLPKAAAVAVNSFEALEPIIAVDLKSKLKNLLCVGPSILASPPPPHLSSDESGCLPWLDGQIAASVAYVAFGSVAMPSPSEIAALAEALEASRVPFLWSLKDDARRLLTEDFLERTKGKGKIVPWAPQVQVLEHVSTGAFVTHCGWSSIVEGIAGGVPMICRPFFGDQRLNSRMVESVWQIGLKIPDGAFTKSGMMSVLELVLSSRKGETIRENVRNLRDHAMKAVGSEGTSTANFESLLHIIMNNEGGLN